MTHFILRRTVIASLTAVVIAAGAGVSAASADPAPNAKSPGALAEASRAIAERNEGCRQQAKAQKLGFIKRRRFMYSCIHAQK